MSAFIITKITTRDARFPLKPGEGVDSIHTDIEYSYAVTELHTNQQAMGIGLAFTLGAGNNLVCEAIEFLAQSLVGKELEELMMHFGKWSQETADHPQFRWLGPHKGVVHLALSSITNACFDLWAKSRGVPLWKLLLELSPQQILQILDLSYVEDVLTAQEVLAMLQKHQTTRHQREDILTKHYAGYDTSVGWFNYTDSQIRENCQKAIDQGFTAMKLKVGSEDPLRDVRRAGIVREVAGNEARIMVDANQKWNLSEAITICNELATMNPYWIEEPTHPDDVRAHQILAREIAPVQIALGEHVPNRVIFKNYLQSGAVSFLQADVVRVAGVSEFITISMMSRKFKVPVIPHVGDMGQIHQHLVLFNHVALGHPAIFLEYIPHLQDHFQHPALVEQGHYITPQIPGSSSDLKPSK